MEQNNTLDVLLQVEAKATALVNDAQEEADKRIRSSEEQFRLLYEENLKKEIQSQELLLEKNNEKAESDYENMLESYRLELTKITPDKDQFCGLLNSYLDKGMV